jgi:hypothetical protein
MAAENRRGTQTMERISELSAATVAAMTRNYVLLIALMGLVLAFAVYIYIKPNVMEFFQGSAGKVKPVAATQPRAEPPEQPREATTA